MPEEAHVEEAAQPQPRTPEPATQRPTGARQILRRPAAAHLHDRDAIALLHQAMRGDAAAEAGADHDEVEIKLAAYVWVGGAVLISTIGFD